MELTFRDDEEIVVKITRRRSGNGEELQRALNRLRDCTGPDSEFAKGLVSGELVEAIRILRTLFFQMERANVTR